MRDSTVRRLSTLHRVLYRLTNGRVGRRLVNNDMLLLSTTGRNTGSTHTVPLLYLRDGDVLVVIASWGGRDHHPDWYLNLEADPSAVVQILGRHRQVTARTATSNERGVWWPRIERAYEAYGRYQARTDREIPVVFLA